MSKTLKALYAICILLTLLMLIVPLAALPFLPDNIPVHFNSAGEVNRWGSRYEMLIFPIFLVPYGIIWTVFGRYLRRKQTEKAAELIWMVGGLVQLILFDSMILYFLWVFSHQMERLPQSPIDIGRLSCAIGGLGLIALANYLPKLKRPGPMGLRTPWSMKNETVWRKCQRFGGWVLAAAGGVSILAALVTEGAWCWVWTALALAASCIAGAVYSWHAAKTTLEE